MRRRTSFVCLLSFVLVMGLVAPTSAWATHNQDDHTENLKLLSNSPKPIADITQSDMAFWGDLLVAANYDGFRLFDISKGAKPKQIGEIYCPASQNDVSVWGDLLIASIDGARTKSNCKGLASGTYEGIRIFSIKNRRQGKLLKFVPTDCGSHTHTLVPGPKKGGRVRDLFVYISSYSCSTGTVLPNVPVDRVYTYVSIIKIPLADPTKAKVVNQLDVSPSDGCHDITVFIELDLAAGACRKTGQLWDISDPANPVITARIANPANNFWHSSTFTWDGKYIAFGDETLGGTGPACPVDSTPLGGIWFYEVANPSTPAGVWYVPRGQERDNCTAHNFNFIPVAERYLLAAGNYSAGVSVIDFTNPSTPEEIAYYDAMEPASDVWSGYFYNGYLYANDINRGLDVYSFKDPASKQALRLPFLNPQTQMNVLFKP